MDRRRETLYICNNCHCSLVRLSDRNNQNESWYCNRCSIEFPDTSNIRKEYKLSVPDRNEETLVAHAPSVGEDSVAIRHEVEIKGGLKALKDKGVKITKYEEHVPK